MIRVREHEPQTRPPEMSDTLRTEIDGGTGCSKVDFFKLGIVVISRGLAVLRYFFAVIC